MNVNVIQSNMDLVPVLCLVFWYSNGADWLVRFNIHVHMSLNRMQQFIK